MPIYGTLDINGVIYPEQSAYAGEWGVVSLKTIQDNLKALASDITHLRVKINTPGGVIDEAFAIINELQIFSAEKNLTLVTSATGQVASAGNLIFAAGEVREVFGTSQFFLHNAQLDSWSLAMEKGQMEAKDFEEIAAYMKQENERLNNYLANRTGQALDVFQTLMDGKTTITAEKALELNLATLSIDEESLKSAKNFAALVTNYLKTHNNKTNPGQMAKPTTTPEKKAGPLGEVTAALKNLFGVASKHGLTLTNSSSWEDKDGKKLEFSSDAPTVGDDVTLDGAAAPDGTYTGADGSSVEVKDGKCTAITPAPEAAKNDTETVDALTKEVENLKAANEAKDKELDELKAANALALSSINEVTKQLAAMKSGFKPEARTQGANSNAAASAQAKDETAAEAAIRRKKEKEANAKAANAKA